MDTKSLIDPAPSAILKLGGSLFGLPDLATRLRNYLGDFSRPRPVLLCGGGEGVDVLRRYDSVYGLGEETCHWLALEVLSINAKVLVEVAPDLLTLAKSPADIVEAWSRSRVPVYDALAFIRELDEQSPDPLPRRWRVTSDSIAARVALLLGAQELVLLKSVPLPERFSLVEAAETELVDPHFLTLAGRIPRVVSYCLRSGPQAEESVLYDPREELTWRPLDLSGRWTSEGSADN